MVSTWLRLVQGQAPRELLQLHHFVIWLRRRWHPTPVLLPGKSHGWRSLVGCSPWDRKESDMTERLLFYFSLSCIGEGNGNPLQCSCLENPRDGRAWWAAVYGVTQSQARLKWLSSSMLLVCWILGRIPVNVNNIIGVKNWRTLKSIYKFSNLMHECQVVTRIKEQQVDTKGKTSKYSFCLLSYK